MNNLLSLVNLTSVILQKITKSIILILVAVISVVNIAQIGGRFLFFYSIPWSEELSVYIFIWLILLGGVFTIKDNVELKVDLLKFKNQRAQRLMEILQDIFSLAVLCIFFIGSLQFMINAISFPQTSSSLQISMAYIYFALPLGFFTMGLEKVNKLLQKLLFLQGEK
jgi:TRAP-type C4-dicarboxylate transport system permease small subunit